MQTLGAIAGIWRYPVKSLAAEPLDAARVTEDGVEGDRTAALFVESGHAREGKPYRGKENNLLHTVRDTSSAVHFAADRHVTVALRAEPSQRYFDAAPVSLIFDSWIAEVERGLDLALDPRRWRPNFFARAAQDFSLGEDDLLGASIEVGETVLRVMKTIGRCVTTTYDVQTGEPDDDVLLYVAQKRANVMGVYCDVELAGTVRAGDALRLRAR